MKHLLWACLLVLTGLASAEPHRRKIRLDAPSLPSGRHYTLCGTAAPPSWERGLPMVPGHALVLTREGPALEIKLVIEDERGAVLRWERAPIADGQPALHPARFAST